MLRPRLFLSMTLAAMALLVLQGPAEAFWGFGSGEGVGKSGLNLVQGYDRNTVVTLEGRIAAAPDPAADPVTVELTVANDRVVVVLGPRWYLQHDDLSWTVGDSITVRGSRAQGRDGLTYLLVQWISTPAGEQLVLRSETGHPDWAGGFRGERPKGAGSKHQGGPGAMQRGNAGNRRGH